MSDEERKCEDCGREELFLESCLSCGGISICFPCARGHFLLGSCHTTAYVELERELEEGMDEKE